MAYVNTKEIEAAWGAWLKNHGEKPWLQLSESVYKICAGVVTHFHPQSDDEQAELVHHAFTVTMGKINDKKMVYIPGKAPVFNLLTTAIFRCLYSLKTSEKRRKDKLFKYRQQVAQRLPSYLVCCDVGPVPVNVQDFTVKSDN